MNRIFSILLAVAILFSFASCKNSDALPDDNTKDGTVSDMRDDGVGIGTGKADTETDENGTGKNDIDENGTGKDAVTDGAAGKKASVKRTADKKAGSSTTGGAFLGRDPSGGNVKKAAA